jgi:hypothetical protein
MVLSLNASVEKSNFSIRTRYTYNWKQSHSFAFTFMDVTIFKIFSTFATYMNSVNYHYATGRQYTLTTIVHMVPSKKEKENSAHAYLKAKTNLEQLKCQLTPQEFAAVLGPSNAVNNP